MTWKKDTVERFHCIFVWSDSTASHSNGIRTRGTAVKGQCLEPLDYGVLTKRTLVNLFLDREKSKVQFLHLAVIYIYKYINDCIVSGWYTVLTSLDISSSTTPDGMAL